METPWSILLLDPATATIRDVKAAYARLLKTHRPDGDAEAFRRVRSAYEAALTIIERRDLRPVVVPGVGVNPAPPPLADEPDGSASPAQIAPPHLVEPLRSAVASGETRPVTDALVALHEACGEGKLTAQTLVLILRREFERHHELLAAAMPPQLLLALLQADETTMLHDIASVWEKLRRVGLAVSFATLWQQSGSRAEGVAACLFLGRLAHIVAFEHPDVAHHIADAIYPTLPTQSRAVLMNGLEGEISLGVAFHGFPSEVKRFWRERLTNHEALVDWAAPEAREAVKYVVEVRGPTWEGLPLVRHVVPDALWQSMERKLAVAAGNVTRVRSSGRSPLRFAGILAVIFINMLRMCGSPSSYHSPAAVETNQQRAEAENRWRANFRRNETTGWQPRPSSVGTAGSNTATPMLETFRPPPFQVPPSLIPPKPPGNPSSEFKINSAAIPRILNQTNGPP